jgi:hypothetical protein
MFGALLGALKGVGSGLKQAGQFAMKGFQDDEGNFDKMKLAGAMQGFGQGAGQGSMMGQTIGSMGGGMEQGVRRQAGQHAQQGAQQMAAAQQNAPIQTQEAPASMGTLTPPPAMQGMTPPTDDGMWERDTMGWRRKEGARPLQY